MQPCRNTKAPIFLEEEYKQLGMARGSEGKGAFARERKDHFARRELERNLLVIGDMD
jgi:hypothetical protein